MTKIDEQNEVTLWSGRPSLWKWWRQVLAADLSILAAAGLWWFEQGAWAPVPVVLAAVIYAWVFVARYGGRYLLTSQRVMTVRGLLARRVDEIEIGDIRNITLEQSAAQRLLGIGDIGISSAGGEGIEVRFKGVPDAAEVKEKVRAVRLKGYDKGRADQIALPGLADPRALERASDD